MRRTSSYFSPLLFAIRNLIKLGKHRPRTERSHGNSQPARFGTNGFGKTGDVCLCRRIDCEVRQRKKAGRRTDVQNRAAFLCDHAWKDSAS